MKVYIIMMEPEKIIIRFYFDILVLLILYSLLPCLLIEKPYK